MSFFFLGFPRRTLLFCLREDSAQKSVELRRKHRRIIYMNIMRVLSENNFGIRASLDEPVWSDCDPRQSF